MSDHAEPLTAHTLQKVWQRNWPDPIRPGQLVFAPSGERIALGSSFNLGVEGDSIGALAVYDASNGDIVHQTLDKWVVGPIAFSPDNQRLLTAEQQFREVGQVEEERVRILDGQSFSEQASHAIDFQNQTPEFSPDSRLLANDDLAVIDLTNGSERWRVSTSFGGVAWSPDATSLAVGGWIQEGSTALAVLDALTGTERVVTGTPGPAKALAYSPDGRAIAAGFDASPGWRIGLFDAAGGAELWEVLEENAALISSVRVSDDGRWIAAFGLLRDQNIGILGVYDLAQGRRRFPPVRIEAGAGRNPGPVMYSPTLRHIAVQAGRGVAVIDARTGLEYARTGPNDTCAAFAPDGGSIAVGMRANDFGFTGAVEKYDLGLEISRHAVDASLTAIEMSPAGTPLVAVGDTASAVTVIAAESGTRLARKPVPGTIASIVFADGGQAVVAGGSNGVRLFSVVGTRSWKVDAIGAVNALAIAGAGIATAAGKTARLLSSEDGQSRWPSPNTHPHTVTRIAASADGTWIATGCLDRKTRILDALTGSATPCAEGDGRVQALAFSPDAALLATANEDGNVILIDVASAAEQRRVTRPFGCSRIAFSFDGALLAAAWDDNAVSIFEITSSSPPQEVKRLVLAAPITGLAFHPGEATVAVAASGRPVVIYDARDGIELVRDPAAGAGQPIRVQRRWRPDRDGRR